VRKGVECPSAGLRTLIIAYASGAAWFTSARTALNVKVAENEVDVALRERPFVYPSTMTQLSLYGLWDLFLAVFHRDCVSCELGGNWLARTMSRLLGHQVTPTGEDSEESPRFPSTKDVMPVPGLALEKELVFAT
jgi:hypothetical protein